jgi:hypothetical protein
MGSVFLVSGVCLRALIVARAGCATDFRRPRPDGAHLPKRRYVQVSRLEGFFGFLAGLEGWVSSFIE